MEQFKWEEAKNQIAKGGKHFVMFTTDWCPDCKVVKGITMKPFEEMMAEEHKDVNLIEVNAEEANLYRNGDDKWNVAKVPAFFTVNEGEVKLVGYEFLPFQALEKSVNDMK